VHLGHNVKVGYFAQNQAALLDPTLTVFETVDQVAEGDIRTQVKNMLGRFMFSGDDINKKVSVLSGGERTRLAMVKLLLEPVNLLILDEPTNHLDLKSKDVLKEALLDFDGTLILVSHDRAFLMGLAQKVFEFKDKRVIEHLETIDEFLERNRIKNIAELNLTNHPSSRS
jgi:ATP-binding cassette subfamily F protein 3